MRKIFERMSAVALAALLMTVSLTACDKPVKLSAESEPEATVVISEMPLVEPELEPEPEPEPEPQVFNVKLCAVGDDLIHDNLINSGKQEDGTYNYDHFYEHVLDQLAQYDIRVINQETVLVNDPGSYSGYPRFGSPYEVGEAVIKAGFNVVTHATNHSYDKGVNGVLSSVAFWREHPDILMVGMYDNEEDFNTIPVKEFNGIKIAFLNYTYGLNGLALPDDKQYLVNTLYDDDKVAADIAKARELADFVIVFPHWGTEYVYEATTYQRNEAKIFVDAGADLIIGAHPHVVEPMEILVAEDGREVPCYWSLGNFISSQSEVPRMLGAMAEVEIEMTEGDERAHLVSAEMEPIMTFISKDTKFITTYMLKDVTEEIASEHWLTKKGLTVEKIQALYDDITGAGEE